MEDAFRALGVARDRLLGLDAVLAAARLAEDHWWGTAAEMARAAHDRIARSLRTLGEEADAVRPRLAEAIDAVAAIRAELSALEARRGCRGVRHQR